MTLTSRWFGFPACALLFLSCLVIFLHIHVVIVDDGFIAHRYAANLVHGEGLVFNRGQRVEGISDLSWTLLMTIPQWLRWRPDLFAVAVGCCCGALAFVVAYRFAVSSLGVSGPLALAVMLTAALNAEFWVMAGNGIESGMYALVLVGSLALIARRRYYWAGLLLGFAGTLRPESLALPFIAVAWAAAVGYFPGGTSQAAWIRCKPYLRMLVPWIVIAASVLAWRHSYYGEWAPNTIYAKAHPLTTADLVLGLKYLVRFTLSVLPWAAILIWGVARSWRKAWPLGLVWFLFQIAVTMANSGDWMPGFRLLNVYLPVLAALSAAALARFPGQVRLRRGLVLAGVLLVCCAIQLRDSLWTFHEGILNRHAVGQMLPQLYEPPFIRMANALKPVLKPDDVVAPEVLGIVSYILLDTPMHDWLGLVDRHVAHHGTIYYPRFGKSEPDYSVEVVRPSLFAFDSGVGNLKTFQDYTGGQFGKQYDWWQVSGQPLIVALRRDRAPDLLAALRAAGLPLLQIPVNAVN